MKYALVLVFSTFIFTSMYGQSRIEFQPGYFVDNSGDTTQVLIKNQYWIFNPEKIEYKLNDSSTVYVKTRQDIKEFFVSDLKYVRKLVLIDKSDDGLKNLTAQRNPNFKKERLFLEVLVEGNASLHKYKDRYITRFFLETEEQGIEQLVYRQYKPEGDNLLRENNLFKQQLSIYLKCSFDSEAYNDIEYSESELKDYFKEYNECIGTNYILYDTKRRSYISVSIGIKSTAKLSNLRSNRFSSSETYSQNLIGFGIGAEFEFNYLGKPWTVIIIPSVTLNKKPEPKKVGPNEFLIDLAYNEINFGVYFRKYFFNNESKKFFAEIGFGSSLPINSELKAANTEYELSGGIKLQPEFGVGFLVSDKFRMSINGGVKSSVGEHGKAFARGPNLDHQFVSFGIAYHL